MTQLRQKFNLALTSAIFVRSTWKFQRFDFLFTFLKQKNIKMIILFGHQNMANSNFAPTSPIFVRSGPVGCCFLVHIFKIKKVRINFINRGQKFPGMHLSSKKTACIYLYPFSSFSVHKFCGRTDGRTDGHWLKSLVFASWSRIYMSIPILNYSRTSPLYD